MNFANYPVQNQALHFMDIRLPSIITLNESSVLGTPYTRIRRPTDGYNWSAPGHVFGGATAVGMSAEKSDNDYNYKTYFEIWRENQEFERQNIFMS